MSNETNSTTASSTHYINENARIVITDEIQYFEDSFNSPETYSLRLYLSKHQAFLHKTLTYQSATEPAALLTIEQGSNLWSFILKRQKELESLYGRPLKIKQPDPQVSGTLGEGYVNITRKSRFSPEDLLAQLSSPEKYSYKRAVYDFVESAYASGINIIIVGNTYSGKTKFLNTLMDSVKDYKRTVLVDSHPEMLFGNDHSEITEIRSDKPSALIYQARRMDPYRLVMDDVYIDDENMRELVAAANVGTQIVATDYTTGSENPTETDELSSRYLEHPYELRVHVALRRGDDGKNKLAFDILSVQQIVHQRTSRFDTGGKMHLYDTTSNRLLFDNEKQVAEPTRTLRRKLELAKKKEPNKQTAVSKPAIEDESMSALVALTPDEKARLDKHRETLHAHFQTQDVTLREAFEEIESILAKF